MLAPFSQVDSLVRSNQKKDAREILDACHIEDAYIILHEYHFVVFTNDNQWIFDYFGHPRLSKKLKRERRVKGRRYFFSKIPL